MISITAGSDRAAAIPGPIAVRSIARRRPKELSAEERASLIVSLHCLSGVLQGCAGRWRGLRRRGYRLCELSRSSRRRSEEHTSELQSLMRISYADFCLKKKNT